MNKHEEFQRAWVVCPTQDNEGSLPDRGAFKAGFFAAWDILEARDTHTCYAECPRTECSLRRQLEQVTRERDYAIRAHEADKLRLTEIAKHGSAAEALAARYREALEETLKSYGCDCEAADPRNPASKGYRCPPHKALAENVPDTDINRKG